MWFCSTWLELGLRVAWYEFKCRYGYLPFSEFAELQWNSSIWYHFRTFQMKTSSALPLVPVLTEFQAPNFGLSHAHARVFFFGFEQSYVESVVILPCLLSDEFANYAVPLKKKKREKKNVAIVEKKKKFHLAMACSGQSIYMRSPVKMFVQDIFMVFVLKEIIIYYSFCLSTCIFVICYMCSRGFLSS